MRIVGRGFVPHTSFSSVPSTNVEKKSWVAIFADVIKIVTMFTKKILRNILKNLKHYKLCVKMESVSVFLNIAKFADFQ